MADEKQSNKKNEEAEPEVVNQDFGPGPNGEIGQPTAALTIKQLWHAELHVLMDVGDKNNPRKQKWVRKQGTLSLKKYARQLAASGNTVAKDWFEHKQGSLNAERSEKNVVRIALEAQASKASRRKKALGKANKKAADSVETKATIVTKRA
jgi:hypothetical protein